MQARIIALAVMAALIVFIGAAAAWWGQAMLMNVDEFYRAEARPMAQSWITLFILALVVWLWSVALTIRNRNYAKFDFATI